MAERRRRAPQSHTAHTLVTRAGVPGGARGDGGRADGGHVEAAREQRGGRRQRVGLPPNHQRHDGAGRGHAQALAQPRDQPPQVPPPARVLAGSRLGLAMRPACTGAAAGPGPGSPHAGIIRKALMAQTRMLADAGPASAPRSAASSRSQGGSAMPSCASLNPGRPQVLPPAQPPARRRRRGENALRPWEVSQDA
jgi:hypothetical protein